MRRIHQACLVCLCLLAWGCKNGGGPNEGMGGFAGTGGAGGLGGASGAAGGLGTDCTPGMTRDCYDGPPGTVDVGVCTSGLETCNDQGTGWGPCLGQVIPSSEVPTEPGGTPADEDCDGMTDET